MSAWSTMNPLKVVTYQDIANAIASGDLSGTSPVIELHTGVRKDGITAYVSNLDLTNTYYSSKIAAEILVRQDIGTTTTTSTTTTTTTTPINRSNVMTIDRINELIIENDERAVIDALASNSISINQTMDRDPYRNTLLHTAITMGNVKIIQKLIDMGADLKIKNRKFASQIKDFSKVKINNITHFFFLI